MTREDAIKKVRWGLLGLIIDKDVRDALETLIPELRESGDERIINQLITLVNSTGEVLLIPTNKEELVAWLNKCKESLHIKETCKENADSFTDSVIEVRSFQRGLEEGRRQEQEKQKEQKPAEWSDNDDQLIGFIFDLLNDLVWRKEWAMSKEECLERLKSLRPSWKPSEEQMEALRVTIDFMPDTFKPRCTLITLQNGLEKLM